MHNLRMSSIDLEKNVSNPGIGSTSTTANENGIVLSSVVISYVVVCLMSAFLPLWNRFSDAGIGVNLSHTLTLAEYRELLLISLAVVVPLILDVLFSTAEASIVATSRIKKFNCLSRWVVLLFLWIPNVMCICLLNSATMYSAAKAYLFTYAFKFTASIGSVVLLVVQSGDSRFSRSKSLSRLSNQLVLSLLLAGAFQACSISSFASPQRYKKSLSAASSAFLYATFSLIVIACTTSILNLRREMQSGDRNISTGDIITGLSLMVLLFKMIGDVCIYVQSPMGSPSMRIIRAKLLVQLVFDICIVWLPPRLEQSMFVEYLKNLIEEKSTMMRYVSHELRTPLNINLLSVNFVKSEMQVLQSIAGSKRTAVIADALDDMETSCTTAVSILDDFLAFDKMKAEKLVIEMEERDPLTTLRSAYRQFILVAQENGIDFRFLADGEGNDRDWILHYAIRVDVLKFGQVMRNLLSNAMKFTPHGGYVVVKLTMVKQSSTNPMLPLHARRSFIMSTLNPRGSWSFSSRRSVMPIADGASENFLRVEVIDSGAGISKENQKKLFGQYVQFNANQLQKGKGSGLGLWISKGIMALHGGRVWGESEGEGLGSRFVVELPLFAKEPEDIPSNSSSRNSILRFLASSNFSEAPVWQSMIAADYSQVVPAPFTDLANPAGGAQSGLPETQKQQRGHGSSSPSVRSILQEVLGIGGANPESRRGSHDNRLGRSPSISSRSGGSVASKAVVSPMIQSPFESSRSHSRHIRSYVLTSERSVGSHVPATTTTRHNDEKGAVGEGPGDMRTSASDSLLGDASDGPAVFVRIPSDRGLDTGATTAGSAQEAKLPRGALSEQPRAATASPSRMRQAEGSGASAGVDAGVDAGGVDDMLVNAMWDNGLRFLVVDDSAPNRRVLGRVLDMNKHTTSFASSGQEFLDMMGQASLRQQQHDSTASDPDTVKAAGGSGGSGPVAAYPSAQFPYDVVLMDHHMPGLSGPKAVQKIRERGYKGLIVGLTGDTLDDDMDYFKAHGADAVLPKPLKLDELKEVVCAWYLKSKVGMRNGDSSCDGDRQVPKEDGRISMGRGKGSQAGAASSARAASSRASVSAAVASAASVASTSIVAVAGSLQLPPIAEERSALSLSVHSRNDRSSTVRSTLEGAGFA